MLPYSYLPYLSVLYECSFFFFYMNRDVWYSTHTVAFHSEPAVKEYIIVSIQMLVRCTVCVSMAKKKNSLKISKQTSLIVIQILGSSLKVITDFFKRGGTGTFSYKWAWFWIRFYFHSKTEYRCVISIMAENFVSEHSWCFINPGIRLHQQCWLWDDSSEA